MPDAPGRTTEPVRELTESLTEILRSLGALLAAPDPTRLLDADGPFAGAVSRWRRALAGARGEEAGLLARGRLAEVENERDALRSRQSELLEQVLSLTGRLESSRREVLALRFEVDRARVETRRLERELREGGRERPSAEPAEESPALVTSPSPAPEPPAEVTSLRAELEDARAKTAARGRDARAALDALFASTPAAKPGPAGRAARPRKPAKARPRKAAPQSKPSRPQKPAKPAKKKRSKRSKR